MNKTTWAVILGILLLVSLVLLILWSVQASRAAMTKKRIRRSSAARKKHETEDFVSEAENSMGYWYNKEDMEDADPIAKLRLEHHFNKLDECVTELVVEMYDCGLVRTEELYKIAYGASALTPDSPVFRLSGLTDDEDEDAGFTLPPVSDEAGRKIYETWSGYVDELLSMVEIHTSEENKKAIIDGLLTYGRKNLRTLLYSPE